MPQKLTKNKLQFFEVMKDLIEARATECTDYLARVESPSTSRERLEYMEVGGKTCVYKFLRNEKQFIEFPTACLYSDEALQQYREEKEQMDRTRQVEQREYQKQGELTVLRLLAAKYPELYEDKSH